MSARTASPARVAVVGGGLAGLTAADSIARAGHDVTLLEARKRLGGATYSFGRDGFPAPVDNGTHIVLGCYTRYLALLRRLGTEGLVHFQPHLRIPVAAPNGRRAMLRAGRLPAPAHAVSAILRYDLLPPGARVRAVLAAARLARLDQRDPAVDAESFGAWLRRNGQGAAELEALWGLICTAALNLDPDEASLALAAMVIRTTFVGARSSSRIGVLTRSLDEVHVEPAHRQLARMGVAVRIGTPVRAIRDSGQGLVVATDSGSAHYDGVVLAVPNQAAAELLPATAVADQARPDRLGSSPIVNAYLRLDRRVLVEPFLAAVGSPIAFVFDGDRHPSPPSTGPDARRTEQTLSMPISAAEEWLDLPTAQIRRRLLPALEDLLPGMRDAQVLDFVVTRERRATFRQTPGSARLRPGARTRVAGLTLAGAWTDTGWPDTIEGAVRSGEAAADELRRQLASAEPASGRGPVPALPSVRRSEQSSASGRNSA